MSAFAELRPEYERLFAIMAVRLARTGSVDRIARKLLGHKTQYQAVAVKTGVPWFVIAALHNRESDADFTTYLGNGEALNRVTRLVPKGRGPFVGWEAARSTRSSSTGSTRSTSGRRCAPASRSRGSMASAIAAAESRAPICAHFRTTKVDHRQSLA